jgi:hypothetical protein
MWDFTHVGHLAQRNMAQAPVVTFFGEVIGLTWRREGAFLSRPRRSAPRNPWRGTPGVSAPRALRILGKGIMRERDRLVGIVQSLTEALEATRYKPLLNQLLGMALLEASECLVREGFEPARLNQLGVAEDVVYFVDAKYRPSPGGPAAVAMPRCGGPYLRLVGS